MSYSLEDLYPDWQKDAHCRGTGVDNYFGEDEKQNRRNFKQLRNAAKLCEVCPVFTECLRWSLEMREEYGLWAGTSGRVRRRIFTLLDNDETTVDDVIEVFLNGGGERYRSEAGSQQRIVGAQEAEGPWCAWPRQEADVRADLRLAGG